MNWTEDDKAWLTELLQGFEKRVLVAVDARVETRFSERLHGFETRISARLEDFETRISALLQDFETKLLTAFHNLASPNEARQRTHTAVLRAIDEEMA